MSIYLVKMINNHYYQTIKLNRNFIIMIIFFQKIQKKKPETLHRNIYYVYIIFKNLENIILV